MNCQKPAFVSSREGMTDRRNSRINLKFWFGKRIDCHALAIHPRRTVNGDAQ